MTWLLANWKLVAVVALVAAVLTASYAKGYHDADQKWELKAAKELVRKEVRGKVAARASLEGYRNDLEAIRSRRPAPVIRMQCDSVPRPSGGTDDPAGSEPSGEMGAAVERGRLLGAITADILDEADRQAAQCNRLIEWFRVQAGQEK